MNRFIVTAADLPSMQQIARVSSDDGQKHVWTELALYHRPDHARPWVAVVEGKVRDGDQGFVPRFKGMHAGTLDRAINWFEGSALRDDLVEAIPAEWMFSPGVEALRGRPPSQGDGSTPRVPHLRPGENIRVRIIGYPGEERITDALDWLYEGEKGDRSKLAEADFGISARTVRHAIGLEREGASVLGVWGRPFIAALRCFDRELWQAGRSAKASAAE